MANPHKIARREALAAIKADPARLSAIIEQVALGDSIRAQAHALDVPYLALWRLLTQDHGDELREARRAAANALVERDIDNAERVDDGELNPKAAAVSSKIRQWTAGKYDRETFGDASRVDVSVKGTVAMHVEAVRHLTQGATYEHDDSDDDSDDDMADHPLL